jgi:hypothetical protein
VHISFSTLSQSWKHSAQRNLPFCWHNSVLIFSYKEHTEVSLEISSFFSTPQCMNIVERSPRPPLWSSGQSSCLHNGDVLCFLWGTNWIYICYVEESKPPLWSSGQNFWLQNGDVLCFLWGTNWIYICYVEESRPPLWSSGQSFWLQNGDVLCFLWGTTEIIHVMFHPQLNEEYPMLREHTYLGCINIKFFYTVLCTEIKHVLSLKRYFSNLIS